MNAVQLIQQHLDVEKLLNHYGFKNIRNDGDMIRACCKIHDGNNPTAFVMSQDGLWYCHTGGCGGGDVFTLVQKIEGIDFKSSVHWLSEFYSIDITNLSIRERESKHIKELKEFIKLVKNNKKKELQPFTISEEIKEVIKFRNFKPETLKHFKLGYVERVNLQKRNGEEYTLYNRLVFPIIFNYIQVGISFRRIKSKDVPKWSHQPANLKTSEILYNYDNIKNHPQIVVCEGIPDVWAFYEVNIPAVATFGSHITNEQYKLLLKTGADLVFAYDGDDAGKGATKKAIELFKNKANISIIRFDEGEDPESVSREELEKRYARRNKKVD